MWVEASGRTVAGLLRDLTVLDEVLRTAGHRVRGAGRWLGPGDALAVRLRILPGVRVPLRAFVRAVGLDAVVVELRSVPLTGLLLTAVLTPAGTGTVIRDEITGTPPGLAGRLLAHLLAPGLRAAVVRTLVARAAELADRPLVVATALVRDGTVLAAQRTRPPALAGRWELPGGRVEADESEEDAVVRECREELGCAVAPAGRVGTDLLIDAGVLRVHAATPIGAAEPAALEHSALRWVAPPDLDALDWVDADRAVLPELHALLGAPHEAA